MKVVFDLFVGRHRTHVDPVEAEVRRRRQQVFDGHAAEVTRPGSFVGQKDGPLPAVVVEHLLQRVGNASPGTADSYDRVVRLRIVQFDVATPLRIERDVPVGCDEAHRSARCKNWKFLNYIPIL